MKSNLIKSYLYIFLTLSSLSIHSEKTFNEVLGDEIKNTPFFLLVHYLYEKSFACFAWNQAILAAGGEGLTAKQKETRLDKIDFFNKSMLRTRGELDSVSGVLNDVINRAPKSTKLYEDIIFKEYPGKELLLKFTEESCNDFIKLFPNPTSEEK